MPEVDQLAVVTRHSTAALPPKPVWYAPGSGTTATTGAAVDEPDGSEFVPSVSEGLRPADRAGFRIDDHREIRPPASADDGVGFAAPGGRAKR